MKKHKLTQIAKKPIGTFFADNKPYKFYSNNYRKQIRKEITRIEFIKALEQSEYEYPAMMG